MAVLVLFSKGEVINTRNRSENLGIGIEVAAVSGGQDAPFFEVSEGVFDKRVPAKAESKIVQNQYPCGLVAKEYVRIFLTLLIILPLLCA